MNTRSKTVAVVDYGMGNLRSVSQAVHGRGRRARLDGAASPPTPTRCARPHRVVLPGQGAMPDCMRELRASGLQRAVLEAAATKPLFGVCVGMQMLLDHSERATPPALGLIPGEVRQVRSGRQRQPDGSRYKVPQMGWNQRAQARHGGASAPDVGRHAR